MTDPVRPVGQQPPAIDPVLAARRVARRDPEEREQQEEDAKRRRRPAQAGPGTAYGTPDDDGHIDVVV